MISVNSPVRQLSSAVIPVQGKPLRLTVYSGEDGVTEEVVTLCASDWRPSAEPPYVRLQSACLTGEVFGSEKCDCEAQLKSGIRTILSSAGGLVVYCLNHEGRGIGLANKIRAYALQGEGFDTASSNLALGLPVDCRDYTAAVAVLEMLGLSAVRLITNNPCKVRALKRRGIAVERVPVQSVVTEHNSQYLETKKLAMGQLSAVGAADD